VVSVPLAHGIPRNAGSPGGGPPPADWTTTTAGTVAEGADSVVNGMGTLDVGDPTRLGAYTLTGRLGSGGTGEVYLGHTPQGRPVAIKVLRPELARDPGLRARFRQEALAARRVARLCTAEVLDADVDGPRPYLVTEYIAGPTLLEAVTSQGPMSGADLRRLAAAVASALTAIHSAGLVHRDVNPGNVLLSATGPRVIDFGIVRTAEAATGLPNHAGLPGTSAFIAPEQTRGEQASPAADIFAWGGVVLFAATGRQPFGEAAASVMLDRIAYDEPDLAGLPDDLRPIVESAMRKDPARRPTAPAVSELLADGPTSPGGAHGTQAGEIQSQGVGRSGGERPPAPPNGAAGRGRRRPLLVAGVGGALAAVAALVIWQLAPAGGRGRDTGAPGTTPASRASSLVPGRTAASSGDGTSAAASMDSQGPTSVGDVDGDGRADRATLTAGRLTVSYTGGGSDAVRLDLQSAGSGKILGAVDVDRDGHAEVFARVGGDGAGTQVDTVLRYAAGHLRQATTDAFAVTLGRGSGPGENLEWMCDLKYGHVVTWSWETARRTSGIVDRYRFDGGALVLVSEMLFTTRPGDRLPGAPEHNGCGNLSFR
jgi:hypothetical protein